METNTLAAVQSDEELNKLAGGKVLLQASYSFMNPQSINGPFGTLEVTYLQDTSGVTAVGTVNIQTLFGLGTNTKLYYNGPVVSNGSTGYTNVSTEGRGVMNAWPNPPQPVNTRVIFSLAPTFKTGTLTVEGFLTGFTLTPTSVQQG